MLRGRVLKHEKEMVTQRVILVGPLAKAIDFKREQLKPRSSDFWVGVDGGVDALRKSKRPMSLAVGDWDSISGGLRPGLTIPQIDLPRMKDRSDLYFALKAAVAIFKGGPGEILGVGLTGERPDHHFANLQEFAQVSQRARGKLALSLVGSDGEYIFLCGGALWRRKMKKGKIFSLFTLRGIARGLTVKNAKYPLRGATLYPGQGSLGLSNEATGGVVQVRSQMGTILVIIPAAH